MLYLFCATTSMSYNTSMIQLYPTYLSCSALKIEKKEYFTKKLSYPFIRMNYCCVCKRDISQEYDTRTYYLFDVNGEECIPKMVNVCKSCNCIETFIPPCKSLETKKRFLIAVFNKIENSKDSEDMNIFFGTCRIKNPPISVYELASQGLMAGYSSSSITTVLYYLLTYLKFKIFNDNLVNDCGRINLTELQEFNNLQRVLDEYSHGLYDFAYGFFYALYLKRM